MYYNIILISCAGNLFDYLQKKKKKKKLYTENFLIYNLFIILFNKELATIRKFQDPLFIQLLLLFNRIFSRICFNTAVWNKDYQSQIVLIEVAQTTILWCNVRVIW